MKNNRNEANYRLTKKGKEITQERSRNKDLQIERKRQSKHNNSLARGMSKQMEDVVCSYHLNKIQPDSVIDS